MDIQDSNQFHAVCLDTYPPIFYMNDTSKAIIRLVHALNAFHGSVCAAYTFDAGPNAVIYTLEKYAPLVTAVMAHYFPPPPLSSDPSSAEAARSLYCNNPTLLRDAELNVRLSEELLERLDATGRTPRSGDVKYMFLTKSGPGPVRQPYEESLLDEQTGLFKEPGSKHKRMKIA